MKKKIVIFFSISCVILFCLCLVVNLFICPRKYSKYVVAYAEEFNLDISLVYAVIKVESDFNVMAVSKSGAMGLMQLLPKTARWIAGELGMEYDEQSVFLPQNNIRFGCFYLNYLFNKFGDRDTVICAYNAGEGKVLDWLEDGRIDPQKIDYEETKNYLKKVTGYCYFYGNKLVNL